MKAQCSQHLLGIWTCLLTELPPPPHEPASVGGLQPFSRDDLKWFSHMPGQGFMDGKDWTVMIRWDQVKTIGVRIKDCVRLG